MKIKATIINTSGGLTLLTKTLPSPEKQNRIVSMFPDIEQYGTVSKNGDTVKIKFWGDEFSGAGSLAILSLYPKTQEIICKGVRMRVGSRGSTKYYISIPKSFIQSQETIDKDTKLISEIGIRYIVSKTKLPKKTILQRLRLLSRRKETIGYAYIKGDRIFPFVYIGQLNTFKLEGACISGTIAAQAAFPRKDNSWVQPSGYAVKTEINTNIRVESGVNVIETITISI